MQNNATVQHNMNVPPNLDMQQNMILPRLKPFTNMMLILTENCNLRCAYCYESSSKYQPDKIMSWETAKKSIDYFFSQVPTQVENTSISFFGGEPHLAFGIIMQAVAYSYRHKTIGGYLGDKYNYVVNTNGTILTDEMYKLYSKLGKKINIRISVDGYKDAHDANRKAADGKGSWKLVEKNLPVYRELMQRYKVKASIVTTLNKATSMNMYENYTKVYEIAGMPMGFLFVHEEDWTTEDFERIKEQVIRLHEYSQKNKMKFHIANIRLKQQNNNNSQGFQSLCSAGINSFTVNYKGDIYACHRCYFNNMGSMYKMGDLDKGISLARRVFMHDVNNIDMMPIKCRKCNTVIRERCHLCFATNKKAYGDRHTVSNSYCMLMKELYYLLLEREK